MNSVLAVGQEAWRILLDSSPYILLGIMAAGCVKMYMNQDIIVRHLRRGRFLSVIKASLFGVPLPL